MNIKEINKLNKADEIVHLVEEQWHYNIFIKYGFRPVTQKAQGFVRSYTYKNEKDQEITACTGYNSDYWKFGSKIGYWSDLESFLKDL